MATKKNCENCQHMQGGRNCFRNRGGVRRNCSHFEEIVNPYKRDREKELGSYFDWGIKKNISGGHNNKNEK